MKEKTEISKWITGACMILLLCWLTVSTPFVYNLQKKAAEKEAAGSCALPYADEEESQSPGGQPEEKAESGINAATEYIHGLSEWAHYLPLPSRAWENDNDNLFISFHGELLSPPPEA